MARVALRKHLLALAVAGILPITLLAGIGLVVLFEQQRSDSEQKALEITRALATAVDAELQRSTSALLALSIANSLQVGDIAIFDSASRRALVTQPQWLSINLALPTGEQVVNTRYAPGEALPVVTEMESLEAVVKTGKPHVGGLSKVRDKYAVALRVPVMKQGAVAYVLSGIVDPASIARIVARQRVPSDWVISVFDAQIVRVARSRSQEQYLATGPAATLRALLASTAPEGTGTTITLEGDKVFTAFTRLPDSGWTVAMGIPVRELYLGAARTIGAYALAVTLSILIGLFAAFTLARRINQPMAELREAARALGRGEPASPPHTDIREVHDVGAAIIEAAQQRAAIEAEREELLHREQRARSEAEAASRAKDNFLAMLGHELRNPLAAISNSAALLKQGATRPEIATRAREVIERQVGHLARLTDDILDSARALLGKIELRPEAVDLAKIVSQALATFASTGRTDRHHMVVELEETWVNGDPVRLDQVVSNLLVNAVKYTPEGGTITVRTRCREGECALIVADTGVGMSPDLAARAFDLFVQGERGLDRAQGGLGIGLTLVRRLAELHAGRADLFSAGEGRGTEVSVSLPAARKPENAAASSALPTTDTARSVLVVEDNADARDTLQMLLTMMGHRVEVASDGTSGLDKALSMSPDVALIDLGLPQMDGYEVARRIRAAAGGREMYLVALTGYGAREDQDRSLEAGFDAHVTKPVEADALANLLKAVRPAQTPAE